MNLRKLVQKAIAAMKAAPSLFAKKNAEEEAKAPNGFHFYLTYLSMKATSNRGFHHGAMAPARRMKKGNPLGHRHQGTKECARRLAAA